MSTPPRLIIIRHTYPHHHLHHHLCYCPLPYVARKFQFSIMPSWQGVCRALCFWKRWEKGLCLLPFHWINDPFTMSGLSPYE